MQIFSLRITIEERNDGVREKELSCLPSNKSGEIPFVPAISSVLRLCTDITPCPGVQMYPLTSTLCQSLYLSYFGCPCALNGIKIWRSFNHCFARV